MKMTLQKLLLNNLKKKIVFSVFLVTTHYIDADSFNVSRVHDIIKLQIICTNFSLSWNQTLFGYFS